jgi:uncharacterized protein
MAASEGRWHFLDTLYVTARTVGLAAIGGGVFMLLGFPAPLIGGGMLAVVVATLSGVRVQIPLPLRDLVFFILGISIGSALSPESLAGVMKWPTSIALLILGIPLVTAGAGLLLMRRGWPREDALLATAPGALATILILADALGANVSRIALVQTLRLAILVIVLPLLIRLYTDIPPLPTGGDGTAPLGAMELALVVGAGLAGTIVAKLLRLPAPSLIGAMLGSGTLYLGGFLTAPIPNAILIPSLIVVGGYIGSRFAGMTMASIRAGLVDGLYAFAAAFAISVALAGLVTLLVDISFAETLLAFAPGGFEVMIVIAFSLGLDAAYVALHQTVRFLVIAMTAPIFFRRPSNRR